MTRRYKNLFITVYVMAFTAYLIAPLAVMSGAALNDSRLPSIYPWAGLTSRWFIELWNDSTLWGALLNTLLVAIAVVAIAVPIGTAAALTLIALKPRFRAIAYGVMVAPILTPGAVIGISTILFWNSVHVPAGLHLTVIGQVSFISAYAMLLVLARMESIDKSLEEAALDLGASYPQVMRRIIIPHLYPAFAAAAAVAFFQSIENFNVTLFTAGSSTTLTVYVFSQVRAGITPKINALAFVIILLSLAGAIIHTLRRRAADRRQEVLASQAIADEEEAEMILLQSAPGGTRD